MDSTGIKAEGEGEWKARKPPLRYCCAIPARQWMHCVKLLGQRLSARDIDRQVAEIQIPVAILNDFTALGIPRTVTLG
jgi:hypothetical protein